MFKDNFFEYRLIFQWDSTHWTVISGSDTAQGIITYINSNLAEMQEAIDDEDAQFFINKYINGDCVSEWYGSPEDLLSFMEEEV